MFSLYAQKLWFLNPVKSNQIWIIITIFREISHEIYSFFYYFAVRVETLIQRLNIALRWNKSKRNCSSYWRSGILYQSQATIKKKSQECDWFSAGHVFKSQGCDWLLIDLLLSRVLNNANKKIGQKRIKWNGRPDVACEIHVEIDAFQHVFLRR